LPKWLKHSLQIDSWITLKNLIYTREKKIAALLYPFLGSYIVAMDKFIFVGPRVETYFLYFGLLFAAFSVAFFKIFCPFIYIEYESKEKMLSNLLENSANKIKVEKLQDNLSISSNSSTMWKSKISYLWDNANFVEYGRNWIVYFLCFSVILCGFSAIISIIRVIISIFL